MGFLSRNRVIACLMLALGVILAYLPSFRGVFVFDDTTNIVDNFSIRSFGSAFGAPTAGLIGRPLVTLSLAWNYAMGGLNPWGYHLFNLVIHLGTALLLWGILEALVPDPGESAQESRFRWLPWLCAVLWAIHPLQTQAVTYVIQRCESLMSFFLLASLFAVTRAFRATRPIVWHGLAVVAFVAALASKEVAVVLPCVVLALYWSRGKSPRQAFSEAPVLMWGLMVTLVAALLVGVVGGNYFSHSAQMLPSRFSYALAQGEILLRYLRLVFWPSDLTLDYGWAVLPPSATWPWAVPVVLLLVGTLWALYRRQSIGLAGVVFFLLLAPTSLVPLVDPIFEHRMYLASAPIIAVGVLGASRWLKSVLRGQRARIQWIAGSLLFLLVALPLGARTFKRNQEYGSVESIWQDVIRKRPGHFRGYHGLAGAYTAKGEFLQGSKYLEQAAQLNPLSFSVRNDLGIAYIRLERYPEAIRELRLAVRLNPGNPKGYNNLGAALLLSGNPQASIPAFREALRLAPGDRSASRNLQTAERSLRSME